MLWILAFQLAQAAVKFVEDEFGKLDNAQKKAAALEFARTELQNLKDAGKLGRQNDSSDTIQNIMPLVSEAIDMAVLITHLFQKKTGVGRRDPEKAAAVVAEPPKDAANVEHG